MEKGCGVGKKGRTHTLYRVVNKLTRPANFHFEFVPVSITVGIYPKKLNRNSCIRMFTKTVKKLDINRELV